MTTTEQALLQPRVGELLSVLTFCDLRVLRIDTRVSAINSIRPGCSVLCAGWSETEQHSSDLRPDTSVNNQAGRRFQR